MRRLSHTLVPAITIALPLIAALVAGLWGIHLGPPPPEAPPAPPFVVQTRNPKLGVHTRLADEVEGWKIGRTLAMVREMGAPWIVEDFPWAYIEPKPGRFDWNHADTVVNQAYQQGLQVIARLDMVPEWARPPGSSTRYLAPEHYADYADFAQAFAARYRGRVQHIVVWNEPNTSFEWGSRPPDPAGYTALLCQTYPRIHEGNPEAIVLTAGLAPTKDAPESGRGWNDVLYLQAMYDAGAKDCFDALGAHAYGWQSPALQEPAQERINFRRVQVLHTVMKQNGDGEKKVYITEAGWNDHPRWIHAVGPALRIQYTLEACRWVEEQDWIAVLAFWQFRMPWGGSSASVYFNFVGYDFTPRPIYYEVQRYARGGE